MPPAELLQTWRDGRDRLARELAAVPDGEKIAWYGPPMSPTSMATARIMETWAHGHDVAGALGIVPPQTDRCKHVCHLGVRTRGFAYMVRGEQMPDVEVHVALTGPSGDLWTWGSPEAEQRITGSGYDFALLATRRRHVDDVDVHAEGDDAAYWLTIVQAFAGLPGNDPQRLSEDARMSARADRELLRLLRRPPLGDARDARGRGARLPHRRLPRRAHDAHPRPRP